MDKTEQMLTTTYEEYYDQLTQIVPLGTHYDWMFHILFILLFTALFSMLAGVILRIISRLLRRLFRGWDDVFVDAARSPLKGIIWILGVYLAVDVITDTQKSIPAWLQNAATLRDVAIVLMIAWGMNRYILAAEQHYMETRKARGKVVDITTVTAISRFTRIAVNISALLITLQHLGISVDGVLAFGGISGIAVGFAAKDMLANFFGAIMIYFDKPFKVGDWVRSPDKEIEGIVEHIGWRMTTIRTFEKCPLYLPNSFFSTISVENVARMTHRRLRIHVGMRYRDLPHAAAISADIRQLLETHEEVDQQEVLIARLDQFSASSCDVLINCQIKQVTGSEFHRVKEELMLKIANIFTKHEADFAFPTQTQHIEPESAWMFAHTMPQSNAS